MKKPLSIFIFLFSLCLCTSVVCETSFVFTDDTPVPVAGILQRITFKGISFDLDSSCTYEDKGNSAQITFLPKMSFINIATLDGSGVDGLADQYFKNSASSFASQLNAELLEQINTNINGINAVFATFSLNYEGSFFLVTLVTVMNNDIVYLISFYQSTQVDEATIEKYNEDFINLIDSLSLV